MQILRKSTLKNLYNIGTELYSFRSILFCQWKNPFEKKIAIMLICFDNFDLTLFMQSITFFVILLLLNVLLFNISCIIFFAYVSLPHQTTFLNKLVWYYYSFSLLWYYLLKTIFFTARLSITPRPVTLNNKNSILFADYKICRQLRINVIHFVKLCV